MKYVELPSRWICCYCILRLRATIPVFTSCGGRVEGLTYSVERYQAAVDRHHRLANMGKVHGSLARAGKVKSQTPKVEPQEKKKTPKGRAKKRITYTRRFVNVTMTGGKRKVRTQTIWIYVLSLQDSDDNADEPKSHIIIDGMYVATTFWIVNELGTSERFARHLTECNIGEFRISKGL